MCSNELSVVKTFAFFNKDICGFVPLGVLESLFSDENVTLSCIFKLFLHFLKDKVSEYSFA